MNSPRQAARDDGWPGLARRALRESGYLLTGFPLAVASFVVVVTGLAVALGLAVIWIGLPIGAATLYAARGFARLERVRLRPLGADIESARRTPRAGSPWQRVVSTFTDLELWREALHGVLVLPLSCLTWSLTITWWAMAGSGLTGWIWEPISQRYGGHDSGSTALMALLGWPIPGALFDLAVGVFAVVTLPWLVRACAALHVGLGRALLNPTRSTLKRRVAELSQARERLGKAESDALRRLERDLHDGPQQTLIRLGMDLSAAERRLADGDLAQTASLLAGCRGLTESVIADIRSLSRTIAPPVLSERGLAAALTAAVATSAIPVSLHYDLDTEPPEAIATALYYVACEAVGNAVKHSGAHRIDVHVSTDDQDDLLLEVTDDGSGGAVLIPGHGLAGLRDRVVALDGRLEIAAGPPTAIRVILPVPVTAGI